MIKLNAILLLVIILFTAVPHVYAGSTEGEGLYIINRGIVGVAQKVVVGTWKVVEAILFGRYGIRGVNDYMRVDKVFVEETPKY